MDEKDRQVVYINGEPVYDIEHYKPGKERPTRGSKRCKNCGVLLPGNASYCDVCGTPCSDTIPAQKHAKKVRSKQVRKKATKIVLILIAASLVLLLGVSYIAFQFDQLRDHYYGQGDPSTWKNYVSAEQFEKIKFGMTYEEVSKILGEGVLEASYDGGDYLYYFWPGENRVDGERYSDTLDAYAQMTFSNGEMTSLEEQNIIRGKEVKASFEAGTNIDAPLVTKEMAHKIEEDMSFDTVCHILGGRGVLLEERQWTLSSGTTYVYETYGWRCTDNGIPNIYMVEFNNGKAYYFYTGTYMD